MLRILFTNLFFLLVASSFAQNIVLEDNFDDDSKGWLYVSEDNENVTKSISGGKLKYHHKNPNKSYWSLYSTYVNPKKPYELETNIIQSEGSSGNGFGLVVLGGENKNFYFLIIPQTQSYYVGYDQKGTWTKLYSPTSDNRWPVSSAIMGLNQNNNLKVRHAFGRLSFLVNDKEIYSSEINQDLKAITAVNYFGIVTSQVMKIEVDNVIFRHDVPPMNVVADLPKLTKVNLGPAVNSKYGEKCPYVAPDGKTLYYVVEGDPENKGEKDDIYFSSAVNDSTWGSRQNPGFPLNNEGHNCVISATPDNNTLYLMHKYKSDGTAGAAGFSISHRTETGWSIPEDLVVSDFYNDARYNEFCLSADRKTMLMTIQRKDTYGGKDVYVSFLKEDGTFTTPKNLGPVVNTFADESSPFIAADGITMYYSTSGYPGYGSADIFMTKRQDSTWTNWSTPQNMGPDINSKKWEAYFSIPASGNFAYVVSSENSIENSIDLFRIKLPKALKPNPVVLVYGKVLNSKTKEPLGSDINYNILATNKEIGIASSSPKDGTYKIVLPAGEVYSFLASKNGFYSVSENIDLSKLTEYKELERNLYLAPLEVGESIRLNNLFFDFNKATLRLESTAELDRVIKLLNQNPEMVIEIAGHTDNIGDDMVNNKLSNERAKAVELYLESKEIAADRIVSKGYGKTKPVASNATDEGRQKNRRVEFIILKK